MEERSRKLVGKEAVQVLGTKQYLSNVSQAETSVYVPVGKRSRIERKVGRVRYKGKVERNRLWRE